MSFSKTRKVSGIPVLFIPGNAGSSRQVRSIGSLLLNKTESRRTPFRFDVFAVDFNEELTGVAGMYLERQIRYVGIVIDHIWNLYEKPPEGIVVVAHSMGGIVIPGPLDDYLVNAYEKMKRSWLERERELRNLQVISISGGLKDVMVPEYLTRNVNGDGKFIKHFITAGIDGVELDTDHLCIVWCNQLVRLISRLLFTYAKSPTEFFVNSNRIISRLFASSFNGSGQLSVTANISRNGVHNGRNVKESNGSTHTNNNNDGNNDVIVDISHRNVIMRNSAAKPKNYSLSIRRGDWLYISLTKRIMSSANRSSELLSYVQINQRPFERLHEFAKRLYCLVPVNTVHQTRISILLQPQQAFRIVTLQENDLVKGPVILDWTTRLWAILMLSSATLWEAQLSGSDFPAVILPVKFDGVIIAVDVRLEEISCENKPKGVSRMEFLRNDIISRTRTELNRRVSEQEEKLIEDDLRRQQHRVIGFSEGSDVHHTTIRHYQKAVVLFILDTNCRYRANMRMNLAYTLQLILRKKIFMGAYHAVAYVLCSMLIISAVYKNVIPRKWYSSEWKKFVLHAIVYISFVLASKMNDHLCAALCALVIYVFVFILERLAWFTIKLTILLMGCADKWLLISRVVLLRLKLIDIVLLWLILFVIEKSNGFIMLTILMLVNIWQIVQLQQGQYERLPEIPPNFNFLSTTRSFVEQQNCHQQQHQAHEEKKQQQNIETTESVMTCNADEGVQLKEKSNNNSKIDNKNSTSNRTINNDETSSSVSLSPTPSETDVRRSHLINKLTELLVVLHFQMLLSFTPFAVCSMWNLSKYGVESLSVYEDPARRSAYLLCAMILFNSLFVGSHSNWRIFDSYFCSTSSLKVFVTSLIFVIPIVVLGILANANETATLSYLGMILATTVGIMRTSRYLPLTSECPQERWVVTISEMRGKNKKQQICHKVVPKTYLQERHSPKISTSRLTTDMSSKREALSLAETVAQHSGYDGLKFEIKYQDVPK
ncbi:unnamed protein product [Anisakis simplex]|uniref:GPI inositol-deacylase n=1 Tax=Anisakis simplex TaxID=6269 RepID=A0A0M3JTU3_ANISI|nr:unnamed protein product [Anisakis simplex]